ncbi:hypothetical protein [Paenibacillus sp. FSL R7-0652]|jgi:hypothetical protein|uniref:Uncharacterized protein n=1 Tax=Paenibacillus sp. AN1007 TaxID=3151385 RepID=A0AAU8N7E7_9BACL
MSVQEQIMAMRNPEFRAAFADFEHPSGSVSEANLVNMVSDQENDPEFISITIYRCPSLFCESVLSCKTVGCMA